MLKITAKQQLIREVVDILSVLTVDAKLSWGEKGLSVKVVDGAHVALISATIADECFEIYEVEPVELGLELTRMRDLLSLAGSGDLVQMDYDGTNIKMKVGEVLMTLRALDVSTIEDPNIPELDLKSKATISSEQFSRALRAAKFLSSQVNLDMDSNHLMVSVQNEDGQSVNVKFESGELSELTCASPARSTYILGSLSELTRKLASLTDEVSLEFEEKYPMKLTWVSNEGGARWEYYLAPRVSNDP